MKLRHLSTVVLFSVLACVACSTSSDKSSAKKKAASGAVAAKTNKQPPSTPKPTQKAGSNVSSNVENATPSEADPTCDAAEEGLAVCVDAFAVFCSGGKVYALDCEAAYGAGATCGELDGAVDCVVEE